MVAINKIYNFGAQINTENIILYFYTEKIVDYNE